MATPKLLRIQSLQAWYHVPVLAYQQKRTSNGKPFTLIREWHTNQTYWVSNAALFPGEFGFIEKMAESIKNTLEFRKTLDEGDPNVRTHSRTDVSESQ